MATHTHSLMSGCRDFAKTVSEIWGTLGDFKEEIVLMSFEQWFHYHHYQGHLFACVESVEFCFESPFLCGFHSLLQFKGTENGYKHFFGLNIINGPSCRWNKQLQKLNVSQQHGNVLKLECIYSTRRYLLLVMLKCYRLSNKLFYFHQPHPNLIIARPV